MRILKFKFPGSWILILAGTFIFSVHSFAQPGRDTTNMIRYGPDFKFKEGVFLNHQQVINNSPVSKSRILTSIDYSDRDFYTKVLENKKLVFYDHIGMKQEVQTDDIWGFSRNGVLYISLDNKYHRVTIVGSICHFVATITTYDNRTYDPYYYNPYDYYHRYGGYPRNMNTKTDEMRQYLLDLKDGKVYDYDYQSLEILLMKDPELHDEFSQLNKKKKRQLKFVYLRKFNERNPLYLPK